MFFKKYKNLFTGIMIIIFSFIIAYFILNYSKVNADEDTDTNNNVCGRSGTCVVCNPACPSQCSTGCGSPFGGCSAPAYPRCDGLPQAGTHYTCAMGKCQSVFGDGTNDCNACSGINPGIEASASSENSTNFTTDSGITITTTITTTTIITTVVQENCCTNIDLIPKGAVIEPGHTCNTGAACWTCPSGTHLDPSGLAGCVDTNKCLSESEVNNYLSVNQTDIWANSPPYKSSDEGCPSGTATLECNEGYHWGSAEAYAKDVFGLAVNNDGTIGWGNTGQTWYAGLRCLPDKNNTITGCTNNPDICVDIFGPQYGPYACINNNCAVIITTTTTNIITTTSTPETTSTLSKENQNNPENNQSNNLPNNPGNNPSNNPTDNLVYGHFECVNNSCQLVNGAGVNTCIIGSPDSCKSGNDGISRNVGTLPSSSSSLSLPPPSLPSSPPSSPLSSLLPTTHLECNSSNQCVSVQGSGPNRCSTSSTSSDCGLGGSQFKGVCETQQIGSSTASYCVNKACNPNIPGDCVSSCKNDADCQNSSSSNHLECYNNACVIISGSGQNKCGTIGQGCRKIREIIPFRPPSLNEFLKQTASIFFGWR